MKKLMASQIILSLLFSSAAVYAQSSLLESEFRPRILDVLEEHSDYRPENGIPYQGGRLAWAHFQKAISEDAPQFIAKLEKAYPGATFAFMGRDTQAIADIVEAFYASIGQKNRVVQVGMSKPTLAGLKDKQVENYLKHFGLDLDRIDGSKPFILVDTVSSGEIIDNVLISGRQGRNLLQIIYQAWIKRGNDPKNLLGKVNMVAMQVSTFKSADPGNLARYQDISQIEDVHAKNKTLLSNQDLKSKIGFNMVLPIIPDTVNKFNESGYDHFTAAWHEKFQNPIEKDGALLPNPGAKTHELLRKSILWFQHQIIEAVNSPQFRKKVESESQKLGVEFYNLRADQIMGSCKKAYK